MKRFTFPALALFVLLAASLGPLTLIPSRAQDSRQYVKHGTGAPSSCPPGTVYVRDSNGHPYTNNNGSCVDVTTLASTTPGGTNGQPQYNNNGVFGGFTFGGDCTFSVPNLTCTKTNGVSFAAVATSGAKADVGLGNVANVDTTNGSNISSGTVADARIASALTGKTYNGLNVTTTTGTLTVANGKTLTVNNTLTVNGIDSTTVTLGTPMGVDTGGVAVSAGATSYGIPPLNSLSGTESARQFIAPKAGTLSNLYVSTNSTQSNNNSLVVTVRTCTPTNGACTGSNSTVTVTFSAGQTATQLSDTTHTVSVAAGDLISISFVNNANVTSANVQNFSFLFQ